MIHTQTPLRGETRKSGRNN